MPVTATVLRKALFENLDKALKGEAVTINYKGAQLEIVAQHNESKLARAVSRDAIVGNPDDLVQSDADLMKGLEEKWAAEDKTL